MIKNTIRQAKENMVAERAVERAAEEREAAKKEATAKRAAEEEAAARREAEEDAAARKATEEEAAERAAKLCGLDLLKDQLLRSILLIN